MKKLEINTKQIMLSRIISIRISRMIQDSIQLAKSQDHSHNMILMMIIQD